MNIDGSATNVNFINVTKLQNRVFCITSTVAEVLSIHKDTIIIPSTSRYNDTMHEVTQIDKDGVVLLFYTVVPPSSNQYSMEFDEQFAGKN